MTGQELERALLRCFRECELGDLGSLRLLELGCGSGKNLLRFLQLGFSGDNLVGNDLIDERLLAARKLLPQEVRLIPGDASQIDCPGASFDIVFQSMLCSSILDDALLAKICTRMWDLVRPGGGVLWYDFTFNNPSNPDVRGITFAQLRKLFPASYFRRWRVTLAPPLSRRITRLHPTLYNWLNLIPLLRTHILVWIPKTH